MSGCRWRVENVDDMINIKQQETHNFVFFLNQDRLSTRLLCETSKISAPFLFPAKFRLLLNSSWQVVYEIFAFRGLFFPLPVSHRMVWNTDCVSSKVPRGCEGMGGQQHDTALNVCGSFKLVSNCNMKHRNEIQIHNGCSQETHPWKKQHSKW